MSDFTGPGRNSEMSIIRSSHFVGWSFWRSSRCPGDSIWKQPSVSEERISSNVGSSAGRAAANGARAGGGVPVEVGLPPLRPRVLGGRGAHRGELPKTGRGELKIA